MTGPLLTPEQVGDLLQLHRDVVVREIRRGRLEAVKPAGRWRVSPEAVERYLEASREAPVSETPPAPRPRPDRLPAGGPERTVRDHVKASRATAARRA